MTIPLLTQRQGILESEILELQTLINKKESRMTTIESLFSQASIALQTLQEATRSLPDNIAQHLEQEILNRLQITDAASKPVLKTSCVLPQNKSPQDCQWQASEQLLTLFQKQELITPKALQGLMSEVYQSSDAEGLWQWKDAYEALEMALVLYLRPQSSLSLEDVIQLENRYPTHTKRTEESLNLQQFSTPLPLGYIAAKAAGLTAKDIVLESSAGNGLLAIWAEKAGAKLILNELADKRNKALTQLFPDAVAIFNHNGEQIHDYLPPIYQPTVAILNPPFCQSPNITKRHAETTFRHLYSALQRLPQGGRLVAITADWFSPANPKWKHAFTKFEQLGKVVFSAGISGRLYRKQGTHTKTRLTVIDKGCHNSSSFITSKCLDNAHELLKSVATKIPTRVGKPELPKQPNQQKNAHQFTLPGLDDASTKKVSNPSQKTVKPSLSSPVNWQNIRQLTYRPNQTTTNPLNDNLYQAYQPQTITIEGAKAHPTPLVQTMALASVKPPLPTYQPTLPVDIVTQGILSAPQLESIIYAGQAHSQFLTRYFLVDDSLEKITAASSDTEGAIQFRRGWLLGDGTGAGKGRQAAGIILDNWLQGRRKVLWISKSDKLIEDARRDWISLGGKKEQIVSVQKFRQGQKIERSEGILFATYALLRVKGKQGKVSRVEQLVDWLGKDFDGVIIFDECHAMGSALASKSSRGTKKPSQQALAGLRLQYALPQARIVYVSATGATKVANLAYAVRLGLWQSNDFPFTKATEFIGSVEQGGLAAMEVVSRDLKSLGLYTSRSLSYEGVEYDILEHKLTPEQVKIYDAYAHAYQIIHQNLEQALEATHIVSTKGATRNSQAKSAARSAFESSKQRFFNHLLTAMKMPTLLKAMEGDLQAGNTVIVQIISTNEALLNRRLADIPHQEWHDLNIDVTPREYIMDYLLHAFPVQLHEIYSDDEGVEHSKPAVDSEGNMIFCQEAIAQRNELIESLALLSPIPGALDQIIHHFGPEQVAEVTGRSKRLVQEKKEGRDILKVSTRPASANLAEIQAFMDDDKPILVFSDAGGTGASYHSSLMVKNQRQRIHYLLEAGFRADNATQGLGRSHRSHQKQPPIFRPVTTNVKGEKRFISTIAKRLDSLGALTKGQRETGSQNIFKQEDNLESIYARISLQNLYYAIYRGQLSCCSLEQFETMTGLQLQSKDSCTLKQDLPPMTQFLNRLLALPIKLQNQLFAAFELRLAQAIETAKANGTYEVGVEILKAESLTIASSEIIYTHNTGAITRCYEIIRKDKTTILTLEQALTKVKKQQGLLLRNSRSGRVCLQTPTNGILEEDGSITPRVNLLRPQSNEKVRTSDLTSSHWHPISETEFSQLWQQEVKEIPPYTNTRFYLITGLLLPIWNRIDTLNLKVWRIQTDDGQTLLGRMVMPEHIGSVYSNLGLDKPTLSPENAYQAVYNHRQTIDLGRWQLRSCQVSGKQRLEVTGFKSKAESDLLKTYGCFGEMIQWRLRLFIPANDTAIPVIEKLMQAA